MATTYQPQPLTPDQLRTLSQELKQALTALYGDRLDRVILYGSYARGDFHAESDVDYLVLLRDDRVKAGQEIRRMAPVIGALALKHSTEISIFPASSAKFALKQSLFYQAVWQEGVAS